MDPQLSAIATAYADEDVLSGAADQLLADMSAPRSVEMLLEVAEGAGVTDTSRVLDAGCRDGRWAARLQERFGCQVIGVDLVSTGLRKAPWLPRGRADVSALPLATGVVDIVWCREVLDCVADPAAVLTEFRRVLVPAGAVVLWDAFPTGLMDAAEKHRLMRALSMPPWWAEGEAAFLRAFDAARLSVEYAEPVAPESSEARFERDPQAAASTLVTVSRMRRDADRMRAALGEARYERIFHWELWSVYLILGKLQTVAWILRP